MPRAGYALYACLLLACEASAGPNHSTPQANDAAVTPELVDYRRHDGDGDGLLDGEEAFHGTAPEDPDTDKDGFLDGVEILAGSDPLEAASVIPEDDFYVILPYRGGPVYGTLRFQARLSQADVFFLVDTTNSMRDAIDNVRQTLASDIVPAIEEVVADVRMGVGDFRDFDRTLYGHPGDWPFALRQAMTHDASQVQEALDRLEDGGGGDEPESQLEAFYRALTDPCVGGDLNYGAACFTADRRPIFVTVTDAPMHNGPGGNNPYHFDATTFEEAVRTIQAHDARVLGVSVKAPARQDLLDLTAATDSLSYDRQPLVYEAPGGRVDVAIVDGIRALASGIPQDVTSAWRSIGDHELDASQFIRASAPVAESATGQATADQTTFHGVPGGTEVEFRVEFGNDIVPATSQVQVFRAEIEVVEAVSGVRLDAPHNVFIVVPAESGTII